MTRPEWRAILLGGSSYPNRHTRPHRVSNPSKSPTDCKCGEAQNSSHPEIDCPRLRRSRRRYIRQDFQFLFFGSTLFPGYSAIQVNGSDVPGHMSIYCSRFLMLLREKRRGSGAVDRCITHQLIPRGYPIFVDTDEERTARREATRVKDQEASDDEQTCERGIRRACMGRRGSEVVIGSRCMRKFNCLFETYEPDQ
jgi:hypothetical protein